MRGALALLVGAAVSLLISGCWDYSVDLPNGFRLVRMNAVEIGIVAPDGTFAVDPHIERYTVVEGGIVTGFASPQHRDFPTPRTREGYFVVDTQFQHCWDDLSEDEWRSVLRELGIDSERELHAPSRFDWWSRTVGSRPASDAPDGPSCDRSSPLMWTDDSGRTHCPGCSPSPASPHGHGTPPGVE